MHECEKKKIDRKEYLSQLALVILFNLLYCFIHINLSITIIVLFLICN